MRDFTKPMPLPASPPKPVARPAIPPPRGAVTLQQPGHHAQGHAPAARPHGHAGGHGHGHGHGHGGHGHGHAQPQRQGTAHGPGQPLAGSSWQIHAGPGQNVILMPGQMSFSTANATLRTLLGSCVSITIWHPGRHIGGMCHYLLPNRQRRAGEALDGRYGDEAMQAMVDKLLRAGTKPGEYVAHLYGGADTMPEGNGLKFNVGERNIEFGWQLIDQYGFQLDGVDVGEDMPRTVSINLGTGQVDMRRGSGRAPPLMAAGARAGAA